MKKSKFYSIMMLVCSFLSSVFWIAIISTAEDIELFAVILGSPYLLASLTFLAIGINSLLEKPTKQVEPKEESRENELKPIVPKAYQCPNCKHTITHGTKFCPECGLKFNWNK